MTHIIIFHFATILATLNWFKACVFTALGFFVSDSAKPSPTKAMETYIWIFLTPLWNIFAVTSDFIVSCMTISRLVKTKFIHRIMIHLDELDEKSLTL